MYDEFLTLCGFEPEEIEKESPRIEKAFKILELTPEDVEQARGRLLKWDLELMGVRKFLGIGIKQLVAGALAREEYDKIVYINGQALSQVAEAVMESTPDVFMAAPELPFMFVHGAVFGEDKTNLLLEAAEENGLRPGQAHCGIYQLWIGALAKGYVPKPDLIYSMGSANCSQNSEADYLAQEVFGIPVTYPDTVDYPYGDRWPQVSARRLQYVGESMRLAQQKIDDLVGITTTDEMKKKALISSGMTFQPLLSIPEFLKKDPPPISLVELQYAYYISAMPLLPELRQEAIKAARLLEKEVKARAEAGFGIVEKGTPRIFFPVFQAVTPTLCFMLKEMGLIPVAEIALCLTQYDKHPPQIKTVEERIEEGLYRKAMWNRGNGIPNYFSEISREWNVDGAVAAATYNCRMMHPPMMIAKDVLEKDLGIPVLRLELDIYDTRTFTLEQIRTRLETFAGVVKAAKKAKAAKEA